MKDRSPLEKRIVAYAFTNDVDLNEAAYKVLAETMYEISTRRIRADGLYDHLFGGSVDTPAPGKG